MSLKVRRGDLQLTEIPFFFGVDNDPNLTKYNKVDVKLVPHLLGLARLVLVSSWVRGFCHQDSKQTQQTPFLIPSHFLYLPLYILYISGGNPLKGTVVVFSSEPPFKEEHAWFITVPWKLLSDQYYGNLLIVIIVSTWFSWSRNAQLVIVNPK